MNAPQSNPESLTAHVARFTAGTRYQDIPADVQELGKKAILDGLAVAQAFAQSYPGKTVRMVVGMPSAPFVAFIRDEIAKWGRVVKATHMKPD